MSIHLYWNEGPKAGFYDVSVASGNVFQEEIVGRGAAFADYDNDGDMDIALINHGGPAILLRNDGGNANNWLKIDLEGTSSNRFAIGARLRLVVGKKILSDKSAPKVHIVPRTALLPTLALVILLWRIH